MRQFLPSQRVTNPRASLARCWLSARAAHPQRCSSRANNLWGQFGRVPRNMCDLSKGIICDDMSEIAVGTLITERPPHRAERAPFGHSAPTSGI
jgi:hypothetical protein